MCVVSHTLFSSQNPYFAAVEWMGSLTVTPLHLVMVDVAWLCRNLEGFVDSRATKVMELTMSTDDGTDLGFSTPAPTLGSIAATIFEHVDKECER